MEKKETKLPSVALPYVSHQPADLEDSSLVPKDPMLFHLAGTPVRAAAAGKAVFVGSPAEQPAMWMFDVREWAVAGVYLLLAKDEASPRGVYVGSAKDLLERVNQHQYGVEREKAETFHWSHAVLLTATGVTRGDAYQLERAIGDAITESVASGLSPGWKSLPKFQARDTPWAVRDALIVLAERCLLELGVSARLLPKN